MINVKSNAYEWSECGIKISREYSQPTNENELNEIILDEIELLNEVKKTLVSKVSDKIINNEVISFNTKILMLYRIGEYTKALNLIKDKIGCDLLKAKDVMDSIVESFRNGSNVDDVNIGEKIVDKIKETIKIGIYDIPKDTYDSIIENLNKGKIGHAIFLFRQITNVGLMEGKMILERLLESIKK